jgi:hypothetical protein
VDAEEGAERALLAVGVVAQAGAAEGEVELVGREL